MAKTCATGSPLVLLMVVRAEFLGFLEPRVGEINGDDLPR